MTPLMTGRRPWTAADLDRLVRLRKSEVAWELVSAELGRTVGACQSQYHQEAVRRKIVRPGAEVKRTRDRLFRTLYKAGCSDREIGLCLGLSWRSVERRRNLFSLKANPGILTPTPEAP